MPRSEPFAGIEPGRIDPARVLDPRDRDWVSERLDALREQYRQIGDTTSWGMVHGDAWQGNVAAPDDAPPIVLDLDKVALGPQALDLIPLAVDHTDFARISAEDYNAFVTAYGGFDVTTVTEYRTLADIQELRWLCFTLGKADSRPGADEETRHRIRCLRGEIPRPWTWTAF